MKAFGTDGLRGRANVEVGPELAMKLGNALVGALGPRVAVGRDTRPSGPMLEAACVAGICAAGGEAVRLGVLPTSGVSALVVELGLDAGVMVTASHNPAHDNGLKPLDGRGKKLAPEVRDAVQALLGGPLHLAETPGVVTDVLDAGARYVRAVLAAVPRGRWLAGHTIVIDAANGAATGLAGQVLAALGARVISLGDGPGSAINAGCGALHPGAMVDAVRRAGAAAGLALDGDADRIVLADASGRLLDGDALLWLCATGEVAVGTVMSNGGLEAALAARGTRLVRTPVGDAHLAAAMAETGATVAAEPSGHVLFTDGLPTGDGLLAGLRALHPDPASLAARLAGLVMRPQAHAAVPVPADRAPLAEGLAVALRAEGARVIVRPSGTEPVVRVMVEHDDEGRARAALDRLVASLESR